MSNIEKLTRIKQKILESHPNAEVDVVKIGDSYKLVTYSVDDKLVYFASAQEGLTDKDIHYKAVATYEIVGNS